MKITDRMRLNYIKKAILRPDITCETGIPVNVGTIFKGGPWSLSPGSYQRGHKTFIEAIDSAIVIQKSKKRVRK